jgi:RNA polymerase sigma-70 factor (ECF subfamily)
MRTGGFAAAALADCAPFAAEASFRPQPMDEGAFRVFYDDAAPVLWAYIRRASGDAALADDVLQEAFLRFLRAGLPAMENAQRKAYLYRTANSLLTDHWRRLKRERAWSLKNWFGGGEAARAESDGEAMGFFAQLKPREQSLLWLAYVEGFDHREIAETLQLREKSVRVLLFRARKKLAALLGRRDICLGEKA